MAFYLRSYNQLLLRMIIICSELFVMPKITDLENA